MTAAGIRAPLHKQVVTDSPSPRTSRGQGERPGEEGTCPGHSASQWQSQKDPRYPELPQWSVSAHLNGKQRRCLRANSSPGGKHELLPLCPVTPRRSAPTSVWPTRRGRAEVRGKGLPWDREPAPPGCQSAWGGLELVREGGPGSNINEAQGSQQPSACRGSGQAGLRPLAVRAMPGDGASGWGSGVLPGDPCILCMKINLFSQYLYTPASQASFLPAYLLPRSPLWGGGGSDLLQMFSNSCLQPGSRSLRTESQRCLDMGPDSPPHCLPLAPQTGAAGRAPAFPRPPARPGAATCAPILDQKPGTQNLPPQPRPGVGSRWAASRAMPLAFPLHIVQAAVGAVGLWARESLGGP